MLNTKTLRDRDSLPAIPSLAKYRTTRRFVSGILKGLDFTEITSVKFQVGRLCKPVYGTSSYVITEQTQVQEGR